ncbi:MAG: hemolysin family protein [Treponema sp.]|jgi:CBS domain containing-hemolysin-like protein|nr:hemolysin family protein [Treponema sp.]
MNNLSRHYVTLLVTLILLLALSAFFSACEMAFSSLNRIKLKNLAVKNKRAALALKLLGLYDKLLSTVLIGNNIVNIVASSLATLLFVGLFGPKGAGVAASVMTLMILIFSEVTPKVLAKESPENTALGTAPLLRVMIIIFTPFNFLAGAWKKFIANIFPAKKDRGVTEDEFLTFVEEVRQEGGISIQEEKMIRHVIAFDDQKVSGIFTPRVDVAAVSEKSTVEEIDRAFAKTGFSRLPVFQDTIDNITGVILLKDFHHEVMKGMKAPAQIIKPVIYVTKTIKIAKLLKTLQEKRAHMAAVVDEYGGTLGIVTVEDIVEVLVGEIWDEHDEGEEHVKKTGDGAFIVQGKVGFSEMLEAVMDASARDDGIPDTTVANWIIEALGRLPHPGEELAWRNLTIKASKVLRHRVMEVTVSVRSPETRQDDFSELPKI